MYESMCNIQSQAGSSEAAQPSEPGDTELHVKTTGENLTALS